MEEKKYKAIIEGILFSMGESVELEKIAGTLGLDQKKTKDLIDEMRNEWEEQKRGVTITELDGAYQMCTRPEIYEYLIKIAKQPKRRVLTDVLLETLSIIAYKQPVTKMEIEKIQNEEETHHVAHIEVRQQGQAQHERIKQPVFPGKQQVCSPYDQRKQ